MTDLTFANMELVGAPRFSDEARDFARRIQSHLGLEPMENPFLDDNERLMPPQEYETRLRRALPEWQTHYTSDDYVDYTWHAPTVRLLVAQGFAAAGRSALARIHPERTRQGMVDPDLRRRRSRRRALKQKVDASELRMPTGCLLDKVRFKSG
jgi:hypothetical protein